MVGQNRKFTMLALAWVLALLALGIPARSDKLVHAAGPIDSLTIEWNCTLYTNPKGWWWYYGNLSMTGTFDDVDWEVLFDPYHIRADEFIIRIVDVNGRMINLNEYKTNTATGSTTFSLPVRVGGFSMYHGAVIYDPITVQILDINGTDPVQPLVAEFDLDFPCGTSSGDDGESGSETPDEPVPSFFDPGDGRMDPRPGDRLAVYCEQPDRIRVWGVDDESIGFPLVDFDAAQVMQAGPGGMITGLGANGTLSISGDANGYFYVAWNGGMHDATGQGDFSKAFQCVFEQ